MSVYQVTDLSAYEIFEDSYDLVLLSSGFEKRCVSLAKRLNPSCFRHKCLLGFDTLATHRDRLDHDLYFKSDWDLTPTLASSEDDEVIYKLFRNLVEDCENISRILVDYSSMSRLWYAGILNWALHGNGPKNVIIDFAYSIGKYSDPPAPMVIGDMLAIPGCEVGAPRPGSSVAIFGLGFYGWASLSVLERLEADIVHSYIAAPSATNASTETIREKNRSFLDEARVEDSVYEFPLRSVESTYRSLAELVTFYSTDDSITLVPMGPKPHVLASILVSIRFPNVSCLRISAKHGARNQVTATGEIIVTRVIVKKEKAD